MNGDGGLLGRGIAFPPRVGPDGRVALSEGRSNVREAIEIVLRTSRGERVRLTEFGAGLDELRFEPNTTATHLELRERISQALRDHEPRIALQAVDVEPDPAEPEGAIATITYRLVATQAVERIAVNVPLGG